MGHTIFNMLGVIYVLPLVWKGWFAYWVEWVSPFTLSQETIIVADENIPFVREAFDGCEPELGMVPLFMAGDKQFFYHANKLRRQTGVELMVFAVNPLEKTGFKSGFCGVAEAKKDMYFKFTLGRKLKIGAYYARQYLRNPWYLNRSLLDTLWAFLSAFWIPHDYLMFYDYVRWREGTINDLLIGEYDWETAADTNTT